MFASAIKAMTQVVSPPFRAVLIRSLGITVLMLVVAIVTITTLFGAMAALPGWIEAIIQFVGGLGLVFVSFFLVAPITGLIAGLFLDDIAEHVEREDYPNDTPGKTLGAIDGLGVSLKFGLVVVAANIAVLFLLLIPGVNVMAFFMANGYLLGREYFELTAMRYMAPDIARELRRENRVRVFLSGLAIAGMVTVPLLNLLTPLFATAFMLHTVKDVIGPRSSYPRATVPLSRVD